MEEPPDRRLGKPSNTKPRKSQNLTIHSTPHNGALMARIRFLSEYSNQVIFGTHAAERMVERSISSEDVFFVLKFGEIVGRVVAGIDEGEWKCKVVARPRGSRQLGVITIALMTNELFVKTVEWEDK